MQYFKNFQKINYLYGNEAGSVVTTNLSRYVDVIDQIKDDMPLIALSSMSKLLFVVVPQAPACSPAPIFSIPLLAVYVLAMFTSHFYLCPSL